MEHLVLKTPEPIAIGRISYLINNKGIDPTIAAIDLEMLKMKLQDHEDGLGWTNEQCDLAEIEYKRFLHLNEKFRNGTIVPHRTMDLMWHHHILDTRAYHKDCETIFGQYFHHFPYFGIRSEKDQQDLISAFDETQEIYAAEFGEEMVNEFSSACKSGCNSSGKCKS
jgi:hypothetical protein